MNPRGKNRGNLSTCGDFFQWYRNFDWHRKQRKN